VVGGRKKKGMGGAAVLAARKMKEKTLVGGNGRTRQGRGGRATLTSQKCRGTKHERKV